MIKRRSASSLSFCALFTAMLSVCSQIQLPLPGVPINMALFAVHLSGMLMGPARASAAVLAYLTLGTFGAPVFSSFSSGPAVLFGPTGGFLLGYLPCAFLTGILSRRIGDAPLRLFASGLAGSAVCMLCGMIWFMLFTRTRPSLSYFALWLVYLPGDVLKVLLAALLTHRLKKPLRSIGL